MGPRRVPIVVLAVVLSACAQSQSESPSPAASATTAPTPSPSVPELAISLDAATMEARYRDGLPLFDYDPAAPLELQRESVHSPEGILVEDVSYASPKGGDVPAFLITPREPGPYPGLIMMHGSGADRSDLRPEGEAYAQMGVIVLLISARRPEATRPGGSSNSPPVTATSRSS